MKSRKMAKCMWKAADNETNRVGYGWGYDSKPKIKVMDWHEEPNPIMRRYAERQLLKTPRKL